VPPGQTRDGDNTMKKEQKMKTIGIVSALLLTAVLSTGAMAVENRFSTPEAGSNIDTSMQNHIDVSHAFDKENLAAGNLL